MNELTAARGKEMRKGTVTADDLARQMADLRMQVENIIRGLMTGFRSSSLAGSGQGDGCLCDCNGGGGHGDGGGDGVFPTIRR